MIKALDSWGENEAKEYTTENFAPDVQALLAPRLSKLLSPSLLEDAQVLDVGTGVGVWAEHAQLKGAKNVIATDGSREMVEAAIRYLKQGDSLPVGLSVKHAEVTKLPFNDSRFDVATSVNVACNLNLNELRSHFRELHRVLRPGGRLMITAPNSLDVAFTRGDRLVDVHDEIRRIVDGRRGDVREILRGVRFLLQSSFFADSDTPTLVTPSNSETLSEGDLIVRSFSGFSVLNNWHTKEGYLSAIDENGWDVLDIAEDCFNNGKSLSTYNHSVARDRWLGPEYVGNPPFLIFHLSKK
jgi:SAM-dependent methyltransferase